MSKKQNQDFLNILQALFQVDLTIDDLDDFDFDKDIPGSSEFLSIRDKVERLKSLADSIKDSGLIDESTRLELLDRMDYMMKVAEDIERMSEELSNSDSSKEEDPLKHYILLLQNVPNIFNKKSRRMIGVSFGPFTRNMAGWKMSLLSKRLLRKSKSKSFKALNIHGKDNKGVKWGLLHSDSKAKEGASVLFNSKSLSVPSFGFLMVKDSDFSGSEKMPKEALSKWHTFLEGSVKDSWDIDKIAIMIDGFEYSQE